MIKRHYPRARFMSILAIAGCLLVSGCGSPKEGGDRSAPAANLSPSDEPAVAAASVSPDEGSGQASSEPSPSAGSTGQPAGTATAAPTSGASAAAGQHGTSGASAQSLFPTPAPSSAPRQEAPVQLIPRTVPADEQNGAVSPTPASASPADAGSPTPSGSAAFSPAPTPTESAPRILQPGHATMDDSP
ncbi:hypothetical protein [Paenibacillus mesotrionivorans]|uniref:Uncharacterized protein n=1 Tax=Paenibacillus mesotrionivorans TaxID=3160968 RepID=A0ACC7P3W2_9BACL